MGVMMRTTIRLNDQLLAEAKLYAAENHRSLTSIIEDALRMLLSKQQNARSGDIEPITDTGNGLQVNVVCTQIFQRQPV